MSLPKSSPPLFPVPKTAPLGRVGAPLGTGTPRWSRYNPVKKIPCDDCKQLQHEGRLHDPARQARWKRVIGATDRLLCNEHAHHWKERDGLDVPKR